jgi:hypothetical protein
MELRAAEPHLAAVLPSVLSALDSGTLRQAAVVLIDGLGFHLLPAAARSSPELAHLLAARHTSVRQLSAPFPTTTPTSLVTLGTGRLPGEHGVLGFTVRVPGTDRVLTHITWRDDPPQQWQPAPRLLEVAAQRGVSTAVVADPAFAGSGLTRAAYGGARYRGTKPGRASADAIATELADGTALVYGYHAALDTAAHRFGVDSRQWRAEAGRVGNLLARIAERLPAGAALIVTADHGCLDVAPDDRFDIDTDPRLSAGVELVAGEPRVRYLHVADGATADVVANYREALGPAVEVFRREELVDAGWFGPVPAAHRDRIGDVVVVCRDPIALLATEHEPPAVATLVGFHGAATPVEREIPLAVIWPD